MTPLLLREEDVRRLLPMDAAIRAVRHSFELMAKGGALNYPRRRGGNDGAVINVMWAVAPDLGLIGVKAYPVVRTDVPQAATSTLLLYELPHGRVAGIMEADVLGQIRTGATSAVATQAMARPDAETLAVFGAGWQAEAQVAAIAEVLPRLRRVLVVNRSTQRSEAFVAALRDRLHVPSELAEPQSAVKAADVIATATGAAEPVFDGEWLRPGTHVNAIGSNYAEKREIDRTTLERASIVAVDSVEVAQMEGGDFIRNGFPLDSVVELSQIVTGSVGGRTSADDISVFKSHGLAIEDVACGLEVLRRAIEEATGVVLPFGMDP